MLTPIILNGNYYSEADHGRFEASLILNGEEIARTCGDTVIMYDATRAADIALWAESYDIEIVEQA